MNYELGAFDRAIQRATTTRTTLNAIQALLATTAIHWQLINTGS